MYVATVGWFRVAAVAETASYLCLLGASVATHALGTTDWVPVAGPVHGVIFLVYAALAIAGRHALRWATVETVFVLVAAVFPFGGLYVERRMLPARRAQLAVPAAAT